MGFCISAWPLIFIGLFILVMRTWLRYYQIEQVIDWSVLMVPFFAGGIWKLTTTRPWPVWLTSCSFPIFLTHGCVLSVLDKIIFHHQKEYAGYVIGLGVVATIVSFLISILMKRLLPRFSHIALGGR